jgi:calpain-15
MNKSLFWLEIYSIRKNIRVNLFYLSKQSQEKGVYGVWLNINGMWKLITLDSYFPMKYGQLFGSRNEGAELWVMLIEKAYAKAFGSYMTIEGRGGSPTDALRDLTGAPCESRYHDRLTEDELWDYVHGAE